MNDSGHIIRNDSDHSNDDLTVYQEPTFCEYCGAKLNPMFYFCTRCATPFKSLDAVIPPHRPRKLAAEELIEIKAPNVWPLFWTFLGVLIGVSVLGELLFVEERIDLKMLLSDAAIFITTCVFATMYWRSLVTQLKRFGLHKPAALLAVLLLIPTLIVGYLYHEVFIEGLAGESYDIIAELRASGMSDAALIFSICVIPAITEEIAFRGLVQHWLQVAIKPMHALLLASALFAAMHFSMLSFPYLFGVGMLLGWAKLKTGSLYPSMLIHFLHNLIVIMVFPIFSP